MGNQFELFKHPKFGEIRVFLPDGNPSNPWFVAADVCRALDIKNYRDAVSRLNDDEKDLAEISISPTGVVLTDTLGGYQKMLIVNEPGLYRPAAKKRLSNSRIGSITKSCRRFASTATIRSFRPLRPRLLSKSSTWLVSICSA